MYPVTIQTLPQQRVAARAHQGAYSGISATFQDVAAIFSRENLWPMVTGPAIRFYYDDPGATPPDQLRAHAGMIVADGANLPADLTELMVPAGRYAVLRLIGPYTGLPAAWHWLYSTWLPQSGEALDDTPPFELNINDPPSAAPGDLITDICVKLRG